LSTTTAKNRSNCEICLEGKDWKKIDHSVLFFIKSMKVSRFRCEPNTSS
jgi:hypothetical protein